MSDWGKGAVNNNIGWGQGSVNNTINWGAVYEVSESGDTDIVGLLPETRLVFSVKTDNAGTSASNQFTIPTTGSGYSYDIETSDGQTITGLTSGTTITFPSAGTYDVFITGAFPQFYFNNGGDKLKLIELKNFGTYAQGSTSQSFAFWGCSNLLISATDTGYFGNVTSFVFAFRGCTSLTSFPLIDTSNGTSFGAAWLSCSSLTTFPLIDTSSGTNFGDAWQGCSSLTSFPLLDTSSGTNFQGAWYNCSSLTSFPLIDTSSGTIFANTWRFCRSLATFPSNAFDTNIASNYTDAFKDTNLSTQSIDDILVSLDVSGVSNGTFLQSGGSTPSATGLTAKTNLINKGWTITTT
jgi:hypothetical protein